MTDDGYRIVRGMLWPDMDLACSKVIWDMLPDLDTAMEHVKNFSVCVQAGGNCGLWPMHLAEKFGEVHTAEPHPQNFHCLVENTKHLANVTRYQVAFGDNPAMQVQMGLDANECRNCGAFFVKEGGDIPIMLIDDLPLKDCGLISLDVEGFEEQALRGAVNTIKKFNPVIVVEAKGIAKRYGLSDESCRDFLRSLGYGPTAKTNRDVIFTQ